MTPTRSSASTAEPSFDPPGSVTYKAGCPGRLELKKHVADLPDTTNNGSEHNKAQQGEGTRDNLFVFGISDLSHESCLLSVDADTEVDNARD